MYECQSVECAFTSPVIIEFGILVLYCIVCYVCICGVYGVVVMWCFLVLCI